MTATKLSLYNGALALLEQRKLAGLTEDREPRRVLDDVWDRGAVDYCLEQGQWNFAMRSALIDYDPSVDPDFGFQYGFVKPDDWIRTASLASDEKFTSPLDDTEYKDERGYWWADIDQIYVRFVSNDEQYGGDFSLWPKVFERFVEVYLAKWAGPRIKGASAASVARADALYEREMRNAANKDAMNEGTGRPTIGSWARARFGVARSDRNSKTRLIG